MYPENPGAELYSKDVYILECENPVGMRKALKHLSKFIVRLFRGEKLVPEEEGYIPQGVGKCMGGKTGAIRAVDMLLKKMKEKNLPQNCLCLFSIG